MLKKELYLNQFTNIIQLEPENSGIGRQHESNNSVYFVKKNCFTVATY